MTGKTVVGENVEELCGSVLISQVPTCAEVIKRSPSVADSGLFHLCFFCLFAQNLKITLHSIAQ